MTEDSRDGGPSFTTNADREPVSKVQKTVVLIKSVINHVFSMQDQCTCDLRDCIESVLASTAICGAKRRTFSRSY